MEKERYWTFIVYPESVKENWLEYLQETGLQIAISPLHNKDINADGELKKEHYHIFLKFEGPTTYKRVEKITNEIGGTIPKRVISPIGMIRYLTHKDNPEKAQYQEEEIKTLNGLDISDFDGITKSMELQLKRGIIQIARSKNILEYADLYDYLDKENMQDMIDIVSKNTIFFNAYLKSKKFSIAEEIK